MNSFSQFPSNYSTTHNTSHATSAHRQRLEQLWTPTESLSSSQKAAQRPTLKTWLKRAGMGLLRAMTDSQQVRIWTKITPNGLQWHGYDPRSGRKFSAPSEEDLRIWLEQRYHA